MTGFVDAKTITVGSLAEDTPVNYSTVVGIPLGNFPINVRVFGQRSLDRSANTESLRRLHTFGEALR